MGGLRTKICISWTVNSQQSAGPVPVDVLDLRGAVGGTDVSGQHLEGGGLPGSVHPQQTKALRTGGGQGRGR